MKGELEKLIADFLAWYGLNWDFDVPENWLRIWVEELSAFPLGHVEIALKQMRRRKFRPNLGDIYEATDAVSPSPEAIEEARQRMIQTRTDTRDYWERLKGEKPS